SPSPARGRAGEGLAALPRHGGRRLDAAGSTRAFAQEGIRGARREYLRDLTRASAGRVPAFQRALLHGQLGEPDAALLWLERAVEGRGRAAVTLGLEPALAPLPREPRFSACAARPRLPCAGGRRRAAPPACYHPGSRGAA